MEEVSENVEVKTQVGWTQEGERDGRFHMQL